MSKREMSLPLLLSVTALPLSLLLRENRGGEFSSPFEYQYLPRGTAYWIGLKNKIYV